MAVVFLLLGALAAAFGPLLGPLSGRFHISLAVAGAILTTHFAGAFAGVLVSMQVLPRVAARPFVSGALCLGAAGCAGLALAPSWPAVLAAAAVMGLGFGALDIGLNQLLAHSESRHRTAVINAVNGAFGLGAVAGPLVISSAGRQHLSFVYAGAALLALALAAALGGISGRLPHEPSAGATPASPLVLFFMAAFVFYVGTEIGTGGWMPSYLRTVGQSEVGADALTSGFWLALAGGRLLATLLPARVPEGLVVLTGSALAVPALLATGLAPLAPIAVVAAGLAIAPVWPTGVAWLARRRPRDAGATSWLFPAGMVGGAVIPGGIGVLTGRFGLGLAPLLLAAVAAGSLGAFALAARARG
jgi:fucose permease